MSSTLVIPFSSEASFREEVTLEGTPYIFIFNWNSRFSFWTMSIYDRSNTLLLGSVKLVAGINLLKLFPETAIPPGALYVLSTLRTGSDIAFDDFTNERCLLLYVTAD